ncbi:DEAD/DEAH box helicase [candidate division KSB1 bacterium]|nr:DEAD/DEAH box helicase [candidate division KSB1 bacterium]
MNLPKTIANQFHSQFLDAGQQIVRRRTYKNFDFVRNSFCAQFSDPRGTYWSYLKKKKDKDSYILSCDCNTFMTHMSCQHLAALAQLAFEGQPAPQTIYDNIATAFNNSMWAILARESYELYNEKKIQIIAQLENDSTTIKILCTTLEGNPIFQFELPRSHWGKFWSKFRFLLTPENRESIGQILTADDKSTFNSDILNVEKTDLEERMNMAGYKSWQQKYEESLWYDFGKLWYIAIEAKSLQFEYDRCHQRLEIKNKQPQFMYWVEKKQVPAILATTSKSALFRELLKISAETVTLNYSLRIDQSLDLKITPVLLFPDDNDPLQITNDYSDKIAVFGKFLYIEDMGFFPFQRVITYFDSKLFDFRVTIVPNERIVQALSEYKTPINEGKFYYVSPSLKSGATANNVESANVEISQIDNEWCYLDVNYQLVNDTIHFADIYRSIREGKRFMIGDNFWLDLEGADFDWIHDLVDEQIDVLDGKIARIKLNRLNFLRMQCSLPNKNKVEADTSMQDRLQNLLNFKPSGDYPGLDGRKYTLRDYQATGYGWLYFLYESGLSGLLCDDMGLGKTYQSLALLEAVTLQQKKAKFLVVCPTSVISHWRDKLRQFKKKVKLHVYHGSERDLNGIDNEHYSVILTSYGIMRNDLNVLEKINFEVMVFDEIQLAKNKTSLTNAAMNQLNGRIKVGLTGTPIENDLGELKALFDIVLPNYLGSDKGFKKHYADPIEQHQNRKQQERLQKMIRPFLLRRTKEQVLEELPPKTEEVRTCELSPDQVKLYKDVIKTRALGLVEQLDDPNLKIPYMHIFAVLNYLKQICNHPAQLDKVKPDYKEYRSGKWDLFCELLDESLASGFKVVIFSQYVTMLALIEKYLKDQNIEFATIKGSTRNRGEMIDRFNNDPKCMVFTASLKAAGLGVNLTGGSVVIHYDRWWNAAREDQATDRVHRIGQTRGVQVFKLITEGTLEQRIDRLISKKKQLMESLIKTDEAGVVKTFDRDELKSLLRFGDGEDDE